MLSMQAFYDKLVLVPKTNDRHYAALAQIANLGPHSVATVPNGRPFSTLLERAGARATQE